MTSCPICSHVNPTGAARCEKCDSWLALAADVGLKPQVRVEQPREGASGLGSQLTPEFAAELQALLREGQKLTAIARFREVIGLGLRESKDVVEALEAGRPMPSSSAAPAGVDEAQIVALLRERRVLEAIKTYRTVTGLGFKEAKDAVDAIAARHGIVPKQKGCLGAVLLVVVLVPTMWSTAEWVAKVVGIGG